MVGRTQSKDLASVHSEAREKESFMCQIKIRKLTKKSACAEQASLGTLCDGAWQFPSHSQNFSKKS
jgi:hypothetical protein